MSGGSTQTNNICKTKKNEKPRTTGAISFGLRDAICFRNCTHSSLTLTRSVAPRDLHLWLPHRTSQNAIFSNKKLRTCCIRFSVKTGVKMHKNADLQVKFQKFSGGKAPTPPYCGDSAPPQTLFGTTALRAYRASLGPFIVRPHAAFPLFLFYETTTEGGASFETQCV